MVMNPKKIAIFYAGAKHWGGIETYLEMYFANADKGLVDLTLVSLGEWELGSRVAGLGFNVIVVSKHWSNQTISFSLSKILKEGRFALITSQGLVANYYARLSSLISGVPNLVTIHSDYKFDYSGVDRFLFWLTFGLLKGLTSKYVVVSQFLRRETLALGVPREKIEVVYNGVIDVGIQSKKRGRTLIIGSLGRLHHKKGYHILVEAVSKLSDLDFELIIWGEGEERASLEKMITDFGLKDRVKLPGFTNNVAESLNNVDLYIQPSLEEGFGITVAEAMYAVKPIIVTPAGSLPELIADGKTGLVTANVSAEAIAIELRDALENLDKLESYGNAARKDAVKRFSVDSWISQLTRVYLGASK